MKRYDCAARRNLEELRQRRNLPQNIGGVLVPTSPITAQALPTIKESSGPQILQKTALAVTEPTLVSPASFIPVIELNDQSVEANIARPNAVKERGYFNNSSAEDPYDSQNRIANNRTIAMSQAETQKLKLSQSGLLYTLHLIREPVVDYQESRGVPRNEDITFLTLVTSLCTQAYTAAITILVMLWNLMPLVDGFIYFVRFCLDKLIDIVRTDDNKDRAIKTAIFFGELTITTFIIFMIVGLIFMPVYVLMARLFGKIFSMIVW